MSPKFMPKLTWAWGDPWVALNLPPKKKKSRKILLQQLLTKVKDISWEP